MKRARIVSLGLLASSVMQMSAAENQKTAALPVSEVTLFSSGVGYFQRDGKVNGNTEVGLSFREEAINDLLKSMVVQDFDKGNVSVVTYDSRDPIARTLKTFGIDLAANPSLADLLIQLRGEEVELEIPAVVTGTIVSVEHRTETLDDRRTVDRAFLNLLTSDGLRSISLPVHRIKLLNKSLNQEFQQALVVLAKGHDTQKKGVKVNFTGEGERNVRISYIMEAPVWKTSYRLVLDEKEKPFLQGWAIVENTTDDDWKGVKLGLVSGRPISFTMDLYEPLYAHRPEVKMELYSSLTPATYGDALEAPLLGKPEVALRRANVLSESSTLAAPAAPKASMMMAGRGLASEETERLASRMGRIDAGVQSAALGGVTGELFQYEIKTPIDLERHKSAMLPIVSENVEGKKLSIYTESKQAKHPLNGYRLKNTSKLNLMQGPLTVFDGGVYAGDARIEDLPPGQERLISYALDLKAEVDPAFGARSQNLQTIKISKGVLTTVSLAQEEKNYTVKNRDQKKKTVVIEHPLRKDYHLVTPKEASEKTRDVYRFEIPVEPGKTEKLQVVEQRTISEQFMLSSLADDSLGYYIRTAQLSEKGKKALRELIDMRGKLANIRNERSRKEQTIANISTEQGRIRENMGKLAQNSDLYLRYVKKFDQQETEIESLRGEIEKLKNDENAQSRKIEEFIQQIEI